MPLTLFILAYLKNKPICPLKEAAGDKVHEKTKTSNVSLFLDTSQNYLLLCGSRDVVSELVRCFGPHSDISATIGRIDILLRYLRFPEDEACRLLIP